MGWLASLEEEETPPPLSPPPEEEEERINWGVSSEGDISTPSSKMTWRERILESPKKAGKHLRWMSGSGISVREEDEEEQIPKKKLKLVLIERLEQVVARPYFKSC